MVVTIMDKPVLSTDSKSSDVVLIYCFEEQAGLVLKLDVMKSFVLKIS
jgi:hypothetical protein